jgi:hypothetical protein
MSATSFDAAGAAPVGQLLAARALKRGATQHLESAISLIRKEAGNYYCATVRTLICGTLGMQIVRE